MADYFETITVEPADLNADWFEETDLGVLEEAGFEREEHGGCYYFYAPEGFYPNDEDETESKCAAVFQSVIERSGGQLDEVVLMGATSCSKYRPGAFSGFVFRITANNVEVGTISDVLERMRARTWHHVQL